METFADKLLTAHNQLINNLAEAEKKRCEQERVKAEKLARIDRSSKQYKEYEQLKSWMSPYKHSCGYLVGPNTWNELKSTYPEGWKLMMELE